ncbi:LRC14 protein, partial [Onychorhynchus coronatus]|nr:LRC14 protein [Onychorhynchus coronatus]
MDSLLLLCARWLVAHYPLPPVPDDLYPVLFRAAFLDGRPQVLWDLVAKWPFPDLTFQKMVGSRELLQDHSKLCIRSVVGAAAEQLRLDLEQPGCDSRRCCLRTLDMTGLPDGRSGRSGTVALAKACLELSKHRRESREFQKRGAKRHRGRSGRAAAAPCSSSLDAHADFFVNDVSYRILRDALRSGNAGPLRLKCREFRAEKLSADKVAKLLKSLDPCGVRRVELRFSILELISVFLVVLSLSKFPDLRSLRLQYSKEDAWGKMPRWPPDMQDFVEELGYLPSLRELQLGSFSFSGNLRQFLGKLQAPLESLELPFCSLLPEDFAFLSQSFHAPALKRLDLSGHDFSQTLLQHLRDLLEKASASLLHLDLMECRLTDSHLDSLLASLRRCSRLRCLRLFGNSLSTAALKEFLRESTALPALRLLGYPIPADCYLPKRYPRRCGSRWVLERRLDPYCWEAASAELRRILESSGRSDVVWTHDPYGHGAPDYFSL